MDFKTFQKYAKDYNVIPLYQELIADMETPVSLYQKFNKKNSFLLESVEGGENLARYSFLGFGKECNLDILKNFKSLTVADLPIFHGGIAGFFAYDYIREIEKIPNKNKAELNTKNSKFIFAKDLLVFDHVKHKIIIIANAIIDSKQDLAELYQKTLDKIDYLAKIIAKPNKNNKVLALAKQGAKKFKSNFSKTKFMSIVNKAKEYIKAGDIFQVVLSQRFSIDIKEKPFNIYRKLRVINPSPYMFYFNFGDFCVAGSSPEILVRLEGKTATLRPIAGTRPRAKDREEDKKIELELLKDKKEIAEHIMLLDLGRNDLGRVCEYGSINTNEFMAIERYSHVMHIVSNVEGKIQKDKTALDLFNACFPAGTVSGAPKIRAMEIIDELENIKREIYAGSFGYFDFAGNMDMCIAIRTIVIKNNKAYIQAGAGIVADSDPQKEYFETINKAKAMFKACF